MKDITIIVPIHKICENTDTFLKTSLGSIVKNRETYKNGKLFVKIVGTQSVIDSLNETIKTILSEDYDCIVNSGDLDFCSQVNLAVDYVTTDHFSILEFDDEYMGNWFKMADDYYYTNESVSLFLPINILTNVDRKAYQYVNEIAWTGSFSNEIGYLDFDCLQDYSSFNLTGGIFNTSDFKSIGGFKPSIKVAFNYEFLLRMTKKELKVYVVPKEGYVHVVGRSGSLTDEYSKSLSNDEIRKWFDLAKMEYTFKEDRKTTIDKIKEETLT